MVFVRVCLILTLVCISAVTTQFLYLNSGALKFITGLGLPIDVELPGGSVSWFTNVQAFYKLPDNITYFEPYRIMHKRSVKSTFSRPNLYRVFVKYFERLGLFGSECIHRVICEVASREINPDENGLLGEIIHVLFSPGGDSLGGLEEYKAAQWQGMFNGSECGVVYTDCFVKEDSVFLL